MRQVLTGLNLFIALITISFTSALSNPPKPPPVGDISGIVTEFDSVTPIGGAMIRAIWEYGFIYYDTTSSDGHYLLQWLQLGLYDVEASKEGYVTKTEENIEVYPDQITIVNFQLRSSCNYVGGDINNNGTFNGIDITYGVSYFRGGPPPPYSCYCDGHVWYVAGDFNGDCQFNGLDITRIVGYLKGFWQPGWCPDCPPRGDKF